MTVPKSGGVSSGRRPRTMWWADGLRSERRCAFAKRCGVVLWTMGPGRIDEGAPRWMTLALDHMFNARGHEPAKQRRQALGFVRAGRKLAADPALAESIAAVERLAGAKEAVAAMSKLGEVVRPKDPPEVLRAKMVARRAKHAARKLREAERKLRTAERLVAKWGAKVRYYEKKGALTDGNEG